MCESGGLSLTQDPVGRHNGDSDLLFHLPGLNGKGDSRGDSVDQPQVLGLEVKQIREIRELFTEHAQNMLVVIVVAGFLLEAAKTAQDITSSTSAWFLSTVPFPKEPTCGTQSPITSRPLLGPGNP